MIKKIFSLVILQFILVGCSLGPSLNEQYYSITRPMTLETKAYYNKHGKGATISAAKNAVKSKLKDPYSAQFSNVRLLDFNDGKIVCGDVNAKNSFGGYTGSSTFIASPSEYLFYGGSRGRVGDFVISEACSK